MQNFTRNLVLFGLACSAYAQVGGTGLIQGTVTDSTGAVMAQASVVAAKTATGIETSRETNKTGLYVLPLLPAGAYSVTVKAAGFQTLTRTNVVVDALASVTLDLQLQVGGAGQSVTISGDATILKTDDVSLGSSMENQAYDALPLAMNGAARDPSAFVGLALGVSNYSTQPAGPSTGSFNGGQTYQNEVYVEGLPLTSAGTEGETRNLAFGVSVEAVDQFQVETSAPRRCMKARVFRTTYSSRGRISFMGEFSNTSATPISMRAGFLLSPPPLSTRMNSEGAWEAQLRKTKSSFSETTTAIDSFPQRRPDINRSRPPRNGAETSAPFHN